MLAQIADVIIETYATESAIARAEKMASSGDGRAGLAADIARGLRQRRRRTRSRPRRGRSSPRSHARHGDDALRRAASQRLSPYAGIDAIAARRRIADAVIEAGKYPL